MTCTFPHDIFLFFSHKTNAHEKHVIVAQLKRKTSRWLIFTYSQSVYVHRSLAVCLFCYLLCVVAFIFFFFFFFMFQQNRVRCPHWLLHHDHFVDTVASSWYHLFQQIIEIWNMHWFDARSTQLWTGLQDYWLNWSFFLRKARSTSAYEILRIKANNQQFLKSFS